MPVDPVPASPGLMASLSGWKATAVALAAAAALSFPALDAHALVLGRLNVLSALGEPLQAEIDVPQLSNEEADSLRTELASPEAFRAAGLEYNSALIGMQLTLQRRPGGRAVIRVTSNRPVNDPFVDLILQLTWSSGRVVRDYTVLLDPPAMRQNNPAANAANNNTPAQVPAPAAASVPAPRSAPAPSLQATAPAAPRAVEAPTRPPAPAAAPRPAPAPAPARAPTPAAAPASPATAPATATGEPSGKQVTVKPGDTASRIAAANKPASVSLDQMLVALLRSNPDAFVQNNVNRMKAGSVLEVPSASQAAATQPAEASQIITAQARDFDSFRRALAGNAPSVRTAEASRSASGRVQTQVDEKKPSTTAPDKLTLSKGGIQGQVSEEQIAREKAARDAADRVAELSKNISELNKLGAASTAAAPAASAPAPAPAPTPAASAPAGADVPAATASAPAEATTSAATGTTPAVTASAPEAPAPAPVASAPVAPTVAATPAPAPAEESSWLDTLTENPMLPAAGVGLLALLAALGIYRSRERKKAAQLDSSFLESKMSGDSFFGSSGGQQVDTSAEDGEGPASSLSYSPSQLDAAGDVDPVAEADVYLAYGRDLQAEEILREALRNNPERIAIHAKLLDIYAKRRDVSSYAAQALVARDLTQREGSGQGHEWTRIAEIGRQLDPANPLYRPESNASGAASDATAHIPLNFPVPTEAAPLAAGSLQADAQPHTAASLANDSNALDFDLDLALDLDLDKNSQAAALAAEEPEPVISLDLGEPRVEPTIDIPLLPEDKPTAASDEVAPTVLAFGDDDLLATPPTPALGLPEVDFDLGEPDDVPVPTPATPAQPIPPASDYNNAALTVPAALEPASPAPEASPLDFDLNLDIDLSPASDVPPPAPSVDLDDDELPELDAAQQRPVHDSDMIEFDLGSLSLDLGDSTPAGAPEPAAPATSAASAASTAETKAPPPSPAAAPATAEAAEPAAEEELDINDPLATKLALAEEFHSIGDEDGAKALAEEVLEEATGSLRAKAERFLAGMA